MLLILFLIQNFKGMKNFNINVTYQAGTGANMTSSVWFQLLTKSSEDFVPMNCEFQFLCFDCLIY